MSEITYDDKVDLQVATNIANINKVTASDMNEIKNVVNGNADDVGDITSLTTTNKTSVVNAINELETDKLEASAVVNQASTETDEVYSSDYLNDKLVSVGTEEPTDGRRVWFGISNNDFNKDGTYDTITTTANGGATITTTANKITITTGSSANSGLIITGSVLATYVDNLDTTADYKISMDIKANRNIDIQMGVVSRPVFAITSTSTRITATTKINGTAGFVLWSTSTTASDTIEVTNIMITKSSSSTYEPYVEEGIYVDEEKMLFDNYSTDEQVIGKWIDGKPIYRKVIPFTSIDANANVTNISISLANLNEVVNIGGSVRTNSGQYKPVTSIYVDGNGVQSRFIFSVYTVYSTTLTVSYGDWWKNVFGKADIIIEYTKTTD